MPQITKNRFAAIISITIVCCLVLSPAFADSEDDFSPSEAPSLIFFSLIMAGVGWLLEQIKFISGLGIVLKFIGLIGAAATVILFILHYVAILVDGLLRIAFYIAILIAVIWLVVQAYNWLSGKSKNES